MLIAVGLALIVALTLATAYFVAAEFAYVAVDRAKLRRAAEAGDRASRRAEKITGRLSFMLSGAQLGITVTALLAGYVAEPYLGEGLSSVLGTAGIPASVAGPVAVVAALLVATVVQMVLGELAPKNLAIARPEAVARALARVTAGYLMVAGPLIRLFDAAANRLLRAVGVEPVEELHDVATAEDLDRIIDQARAGGHLDPELSRLLDHGLDFRTRTAGEVMVPRVDVVTVPRDAPLTRVVELTASGHSRFPVTGDGVDDIIGVVALADLLTVAPAERGRVRVADVAAAPVFVPESVRLPALLDVLRHARRQMAVVVDEYGGVAGIAHLEDIAEELVGVIRDEDDIAEPEAVAEPDGAWLVPARWRVDEVTEATGIVLPDDDVYDTVSGLVLHRLGRIPRVGDHVEIDGPVVLEVVSMGRHVPTTIPGTRMSTGLGLTLSALLLAGNAFFVAAEFALVAAKRHRLEEAAARGSRGARAAVAGVRQLSMMLAGAQLGITLCTLGLGALAEPAIAHLVDPLLHAVGLPERVSYAFAFAFALALVTFLHMVVGEMAPKSWAITDPQRSAIALAIPFRAVTRVVRPVLTALNGAANVVLRLFKVTPVDELAQAHGPDELRMLIESSREHGTLPAEQHLLLSRMLRLQDTTVDQIAVPWDGVITVDPAASAGDVERISRESGRSRIVVADPGATVHGLVHVRDAIRATTIAGRPEITAADLALPAHTMPAGRSVLAGVRSMRETRNQLAVVVDGDGRPTGVVALEDLLEQVIGPFEDETDHLSAHASRRTDR